MESSEAGAATVPPGGQFDDGTVRQVIAWFLIMYGIVLLADLRYGTPIQFFSWIKNVFYPPTLRPGDNRPPSSSESYAIFPPLLPNEDSWQLISRLTVEHGQVRIGEIITVVAQVDQRPGFRQHVLSGYAATISCLLNCVTSEPLKKASPSGTTLTWSWDLAGKDVGLANVTATFSSVEDNTRVQPPSAARTFEVFDRDGYSEHQLAIWYWVKWIFGGFGAAIVIVGTAMLTKWGENLFKKLKNRVRWLS